jgi:hypothetical protein
VFADRPEFPQVSLELSPHPPVRPSEGMRPQPFRDRRFERLFLQSFAEMRARRAKNAR